MALAGGLRLATWRPRIGSSPLQGLPTAGGTTLRNAAPPPPTFRQSRPNRVLPHSHAGLPPASLLRERSGARETRISGFGSSRWVSGRDRLRGLGRAGAATGRNGKKSDSMDGWDPSLELEVPADQRPVNELKALKEALLYSWAELSPPEFRKRIGLLWLLFFTLLGGPIAAASFDPLKEPLVFLLAGGAGSLFAVAILILRMYLGWSYVGNRLLSAVVPYEESGWYDGQMFVKPPEVLARDRLLGSYQVKPVMARLKQTMVGAAALLALSVTALIVVVPQPGANQSVVYVQRRLPDGTPSSERVGFRLRDLTNPPVEVMDDDDLAAAAAAAAKGRPAYCSDRFYRALAGGQYCRWSDLKR